MGSFIQVGPGKFDLQDFSMVNFLDGYAILTKLEINGQNKIVKLEKKYAQSEAYKKAVANGKPFFTEFATRPPREETQGFFSKVLTTFVSSNSYV